MLELTLYKKAAMIVVAVKGMKQIITDKGVDAKKIHFIPNGIDSERFALKGEPLLRTKDMYRDKFLVGYVGTIGMAHGLEILPKTAELLKDTNIHFIIIGDGAERENIESYIREKKLSNISMLGKMPRDRIPSILKELDLGFVHLKKFPLMDNAVPSKIYEIMAAGIPVLAGISGIGKQFIEDNGFGFVFEQENEISLETVLRSVIKEDRKKLEHMGRNGQKVAFEKYDRKKQAMKYLSYIKEL